MLERSKVAIVIPAYNEAVTITHVVQDILKYGEIIVVDDCSSDATGSLAEAAGAVVVRHHSNQGYDRALNSGFIEANRRGCLYAITFDADGQHSAIFIEQFLVYLKQGYDLVLGKRPDYARLAERFFAFYTKIRFGLYDPLCGMKGYNMSLYNERGCFDSYQSIGTELALYGLLKKKSFVQPYIHITKREGTSRFGQRWKANYKILRAMFFSLLKL